MKIHYGHKTVAVMVWKIFVVLLAFTLLCEFFIAPSNHFALQEKYFFHAWYGFSSCIMIVLFSRVVGYFLKRKVLYYKEGKPDVT